MQVCVLMTLLHLGNEIILTNLTWSVRVVNMKMRSKKTIRSMLEACAASNISPRLFYGCVVQSFGFTTFYVYEFCLDASRLSAEQTAESITQDNYWTPEINDNGTLINIYIIPIIAILLFFFTGTTRSSMEQYARMFRFLRLNSIASYLGKDSRSSNQKA